jgi:hypothetical protein
MLVYLSLSGNAQEKTNRLRVASPYGHLPGFRVDGLIAKSNDDLRQEVLHRLLAHLDERYVRGSDLDWNRTANAYSYSFSCLE